MPQIKGLLIDLEGVVYQGRAALPGAVEAIRRLRGAGFPYRFLTNTTSQPIEQIRSKLGGLGIAAEPGDIFTPALAAREWLAERDLSPRLLIAAALEADFGDLAGSAGEAVVIGDAREGFTYAALNAAFRKIKEGAVFVALASNRMFIDDNGAPSLDVGAFVAALEYASGQDAVVLGKPAPGFFRLACTDIGLAPQHVAMIGDDAEFDVIAAGRAGLTGYLVHTGKWSPEVLASLESEPNAEFEDLAAAVDHVLGQRGAG
jgi:HAD superfamily hydrolase (TIGR01458 family)